MTLSHSKRRAMAKRAAQAANRYAAEALAAVGEHTALQRAEAQAAAEARRRYDEGCTVDLDGIGPGDYVRDRHGWHRVVRVNAGTVTVETPYSWTDRILKDRIVETRKAWA